MDLSTVMGLQMVEARRHTPRAYGEPWARLPIMELAPVLLLGFNRTSTLERVITRLAESRPERMYVAADGPRDHTRFPHDAERCQRVRDMLDALPWPCTVKTRFLPSNQGLGKAVSGALHWFFEHEPYGIVLEDDCLPARDFLPFCSELLERYADQPKVMSIRGSRFARPGVPSGPSFSASRVFDCHGWASWRRAWHLYRFDIADWRQRAGHPPLQQLGRVSARYWSRRFDEVARENPPRNWARQYHLAHFLASGLSLVPRVNLISHIGGGDGATNCVRGFLWDDNPTGSLAWPLRDPESLEPDARLERTQEAWRHGHRPWLSRKFWQFMNRWQLGSLALRRGGVDRELVQP